MKKFRNLLTTKWCAMLSALLGVLGFAANGCKSSGDVYEPELYGQPYAKFKVEGAVFNEEHKPVEGAVVYVREHYGDTTKTGKDGSYVFDSERIMPFSEYWVMAEDPSGTYEADSVRIEPKFEGGESWYEGDYSTTHDFTLKTKTPETEEQSTPEE